MILRHEKELSQKGSIIVVPLDIKPAFETLIDRKGVDDALSGDILSPCAEKVNEENAGKSQVNFLFHCVILMFKTKRYLGQFIV
jgi:hypothetical protein